MNEELKRSLSEASTGLIYISETDAGITPFEGGPAGEVTAANLLAQAGAAADSPVEERGFDEIFERLTRVYDGAGEEQAARANRFAALKDLLAQNLRDLKVFKVGRIQVDIYMVGLDADGNLSGVKTQAVET
jgi:hypothetical protein